MNKAGLTYLLQKKASVLSAIALLSLSVIIAVIAFYQGYKRNLSRQKVIELAAVTNLKADDISIWFKYRLKDAADLSRNEIFKDALSKYMSVQTRRNSYNLYSYLKSFKTEKEYSEIYIANPDGYVMFATDTLGSEPDAQLRDSIQRSARLQRPLSNDFYLYMSYHKRYIDFISPVIDKNKTTNAVVILRVDPEKSLFPLVRSWPSEENTTRNVLVSANGDTLLLLSFAPVNGKIQKNTIESLNLPKGSSFSDFTGITKLTNPYNKKELAYVRPIKGTSWHLVSMIAKQNTFRQVGNSGMIFFLTVLSVLLFIVGIALVYMLYKRNSYLKLFLAQEEFRITLYSIGDAVITTDRDGRIKAMNHVASEMTGFKEREAKGKYLRSVLHIINEITGEKVEYPSGKVLEERKVMGLSSHSVLITRKGKRIPISDSSAPIMDANGEITGIVLVFRDETADREKQRIIEESEKKYRNLFDSTNDGLCLLQIIRDENGNFMDCKVLDTNPNFELLSGEKRDLIKGTKISDLHGGKHKQFLPQALDKINKGEKMFFEIYNQPTKKHLSITIYPNTYDTFVMVLQDVTERKTAELRQNALYRVAESMISSPTISDLANVIIRQIESVLHFTDLKIELYGTSKKNISSLSFEGAKYTRTIDKPVRGSIQDYCLQNNKPVILNEKSLDTLKKEGLVTESIENIKSCIVIPLMSNTVPLATLTIVNRDTNETFNESVVFFIEIIINQARIFIDRKVYEDEITKLSKGIIQSPVSIVITDKDSYIEYVNPKYLQVTGYKAEDLIGKKYSDVRKDFIPADSFEEMISKMGEGREWSGELLSATQNGEQIWESIHISPIFDNNGNITHYISIRDDITEEKTMIEKLIVAKEKAEESDRLKTSFLANMSHEVRTPMNAIIGFAELLGLSTISKGEQLEYSQIIKQRSFELLAIIDDIIDVSRLETGKLKMFRTNVNVKDLLNDIFTTANTVWRESGKSMVKFELIEENPGKDITIFTDSGRLRQILINLIDNAFKFTEEGVIRFGCKDDREGILLFYVSDTGIGIPEEKQTIIFERFRQVEEDYSRKKGGLGLGLSICKGLVEILEGNIWVKSAPQSGSTFFFTIPYGKVPEEKETQKNKKMINNDNKGIWLNRRLLVIEDEPLNAKYIINALEPSGINIIHADTGAGALEIIKRDQDFDAILLDIRLPDIDGFELAKQMKAINPKLIIIAQTAYVSDQYRKMCIEAGCTDYLAKPFKVQDLFEVISKYI
jgi:PAS domain S-box-containing protein